MAIAIHPAVDNGVKAGSPEFQGGTLTCKCSDAPVTVSIRGNVAFNHVCGCTKCWKPAGALFSMVAVTPRDNLNVTANAQKLKVVDASARDPALRLHRMRRAHVRPHREQEPRRSTALTSCTRSSSRNEGWAAPEFAAFVSSIIESGTKPDQMGAVRARLKELKLEPYDCLSPALMDLIATNAAKAKGVLAA